MDIILNTVKDLSIQDKVGTKGLNYSSSSKLANNLSQNLASNLSAGSQNCPVVRECRDIA
jgi:hypothetical protein